MKREDNPLESVAVETAVPGLSTLWRGASFINRARIDAFPHRFSSGTIRAEKIAVALE